MIRRYRGAESKGPIVAGEGTGSGRHAWQRRLDHQHQGLCALRAPGQSQPLKGLPVIGIVEALQQNIHGSLAA